MTARNGTSSKKCSMGLSKALNWDPSFGTLWPSLGFLPRNSRGGGAKIIVFAYDSILIMEAENKTQLELRIDENFTRVKHWLRAELKWLSTKLKLYL